MCSFSLILCLLGLTLIMGSHVAHAQDSPTDYVNAHNIARSAITTIKIPNIVWDNKVAAYAQNYANQRKDCKPIPFDSGGRYGENIAVSLLNNSFTVEINSYIGFKGSPRSYHLNSVGNTI